MAATSGIHNGNDVVKVLLVGAKAAQMASAIYQHGVSYIQKVNQEIGQWMEQKNYSKLDDFVGKLSQENIKNPMFFERSQFMKYFSDYHH